VIVDPDLRVPGVKKCVCDGDTAESPAITWQHRPRLSVRDPAWRLRRPNAAADLLGLPTEPYEQKTYVVCLDLGSSGAVFARGWNPQLEQVGALAKATKARHQHRVDLSAAS